ncbi:MAG: PadR family transcriptional regulator [Streptosporangiales bacterium]|nr:PadR family transcriptional regulator [Streptosporangiales bacterium]
MSATRLLVLGVVRVYGCAHGYLVRNDLVSWGAEEWANVKWGSIYHALRQMAKEGLLEASDGPNWRVDYTITDQGEATFERLLRDALREPSTRRDLLTAGLAFITALPRAEAVTLLEERLKGLQDEVDAAAHLDTAAGAGDGPSHLPELFGLWAHSVNSSIEWTSGLIDRLTAGEYVMADDDPKAFGTLRSRTSPARTGPIRQWCPTDPPAKS